MLEDTLLDLTRRGEVVLDLFLGSGSTVMAPEKAGRTCHAVEIDPLYLELSYDGSRLTPAPRRPASRPEPFRLISVLWSAHAARSSVAYTAYRPAPGESLA
jgi:hypothetical protein